MIKDYKGWILISNLIILFPIIMGIIMWNKLPYEMPLHFNSYGKADSFCDKWVGVFVIPLIPLALHWIIILMCATDKKIKTGMPVGRKIFVAILLFVPIISVYAALQEYAYVFNYKISSGRLALAMLGIVYVVLGNYIPKIKQNNTIGVRLPWIMNDSYKWMKTNRFGGYLMFLLGVAMLATSFIHQLTSKMCVVIIIGGNIILFLVIVVYSLFLKENNNK